MAARTPYLSASCLYISSTRESRHIPGAVHGRSCRRCPESEVMRLVQLSLFSLLLVVAADSQQYSFATGDYIIQMEVRFLASYSGEPLVFYDTADPGKKICGRIGESE